MIDSLFMVYEIRRQAFEAKAKLIMLKYLRKFEKEKRFTEVFSEKS